MVVLLLQFWLAGPVEAGEWHHPLSLDGGGYWHRRISVTVHNEGGLAAEGEPVALSIGKAPDEVPLAGEAAEAIRVWSASGVEMLFGLFDPRGSPLEEGPIPQGSTLVIPAECEPGQSAGYYVYYDNPAAARVPDFLSIRPGLINGGVELGEGSTPTGWRHDAPDDRHEATWSTESPQSGRKCLKTVVAAGAEPTWIATRQFNIHVTGGARYRMTAWVRADDVDGLAGWYVHVGNRKDPMLIGPMLSGGEGTYSWKQVTAEFTAPAEANLANVGTVLRGTGTAWFDNVTLEPLDSGNLWAKAGTPEQADLREVGAGGPWLVDPSNAQIAWDRRAVVKVFNFASDATGPALAAVDLRRLNARAHGRLNRHSIRVTHAEKPVPHHLYGDSVLFEANVPARAVGCYHVYFSDDPRITGVAATDSGRPLIASHNRVKNPGFESGDPMPDDWFATGPARSPDGVTFGLDASRHRDLGSRSVKMHVPSGVAPTWRGWQQSVPVEPGRTYLFSTWLRCEGVDAGDVRVHAHRHTADGSLSKHNPMVSIGPPLGGTSDWTLLSGRFTMPEDTVSFRLHLTMNTSGTLWHDGVLLAEILPGRVIRLEGKPTSQSDALVAWQVPAVVKVFRDDVPKKVVPELRISAARNEQEPLQLVLRSGRPMRDVKVEVDPPAGPQGARLHDVEIHRVGYVPIDHPTNYYRSDSPAWHRKTPNREGGCDGWPGDWPDPLLPGNTFDLPAGQSQPIWITVSVGKKAPAGDYRGSVRLLGEGEVVRAVPFVVHVWDFTLPDESHVAAIYDVRLGPGSRFWGKSFDEVYPEIVRFMARRRLCPDRVHPDPVFRMEDGQVAADFTAFDEAASVYFDELGLPLAYTPRFFYLFGWGHPPKTIFGQRPYAGDPPYEGVDRSRLRPEYQRAYQACLQTFWDHVKAKGWHEKFVLYISDEPFDRHEHIRLQMKALCEMIHEVDPKIPIYSSTWRHVPGWDGSLDVWGIGHDGRVPKEKMGELRASGDRLWFTTDGQMCTDTPYCAVERLLPHYCFQHDVEAYEFWGVGWLTYDPYRFGWHAYIHQSSEPGSSYWVRYPNGDGFLLYPGTPLEHSGLVTSVRLEQAREGVEDYEYLDLLRRRIDRARAAGRDVSGAVKAMQAAAMLATIPNPGGRYSTKILPDPEAVYRARRSVAAAIEALGR
jgi:hypothetical protein